MRRGHPHPARPAADRPPRKGEGERRRSPTSFILVANLDARDGGAAIVAGNERVVRARLADAKFFWETDRKIRLGGPAREAENHRLPREARHAVRARRAHRGAGAGAGPDRRRRPGRWPSAPPASPRPTSSPRWSASSPSCRASWAATTRPLQGEHPSVAAAIEEHYKPLGPSDRVPTDPVVGRRGAGRQDRHAGGLLGDRREADREQGPVCAAAGGVGGDPVGVGE